MNDQQCTRTYYYSNHNRREEYEYVNDCNDKESMKNGLYKKWYNDGTLMKFCYYSYDLLHGFYEEYYSNGLSSIQSNFIYGSQNGKRTEWYSTGKLKSTCYYKNGKLNGPQKIWGPDGTLNNSFYFNKFSRTEGLYLNKTIKNDISYSYHINDTFKSFNLKIIMIFLKVKNYLRLKAEEKYLKNIIDLFPRDLSNIIYKYKYNNKGS
jgi:antitoxin component YwqK of YwqJK toxin-antitoxin module